MAKARLTRNVVLNEQSTKKPATFFKGDVVWVEDKRAEGYGFIVRSTMNGVGYDRQGFKKSDLKFL